MIKRKLGQGLEVSALSLGQWAMAKHAICRTGADD